MGAGGGDHAGGGDGFGVWVVLPWGGRFPGAIMAALVLVMCLAGFVAFVRRVIVVLDRGMGRVVVRVASVFGTTETGAALADVARA